VFIISFEPCLQVAGRVRTGSTRDLTLSHDVCVRAEHLGAVVEAAGHDAAVALMDMKLAMCTRSHVILHARLSVGLRSSDCAAAMERLRDERGAARTSGCDLRFLLTVSGAGWALSDG
jgi:hypothetical protein